MACRLQTLDISRRTHHPFVIYYTVAFVPLLLFSSLSPFSQHRMQYHGWESSYEEPNDF